MTHMLGRSRTWRWLLCPCRHCRYGPKNKAWKQGVKRSARYREERLWRREQAS